MKNHWKKITSIILIVLLIIIMPRMTFAALSVVQHKPGTSTANSVTISITVTATGSNNLLVVGTGNTGTRTVTSVSDGANNFTQFPSANKVNGTVESDVWYLPSSTSGKTSITITFSGVAGTFDKFGEVWEVSGMSSPTNDGAATASGNSSGNTFNGGSVTTTDTGFVVGVNIENGFGVIENPASGNEFISGGDAANTGGLAYGVVSLISGTAAAHQPVWTTNSDSAQNTETTAAFKNGAVVSTVTPAKLNINGAVLLNGSLNL